MKNKTTGKLLDQKDIKRAAWRNIFFMQATQNFERMMGLAFCHIMVPIIDKLYKNDPEEHKKALQRHMQFIIQNHNLVLLFQVLSLPWKKLERLVKM